MCSNLTVCSTFVNLVQKLAVSDAIVCVCVHACVRACVRVHAHAHVCVLVDKL